MSRLCHVVVWSCLLLGLVWPSSSKQCDHHVANYAIDKVTTEGDHPVAHIEGLTCAKTFPSATALASSYLCEAFLAANREISAYNNAVYTLERLPYDARALACLSAIYMKSRSYIRAFFYAEIASRYISSNRSTLHSCNPEEYMVRISKTFPNAANPSLTNVGSCLLDSFYQRIVHSINGTLTLYSVVLRYMDIMPPTYRGLPYIYIYEMFLESVEILLAGHCPKSDLVVSRHINPVAWDAERVINILSHPHSAPTFSETAFGLSDGLNNIHVPNRISTVSLTDQRFVSIHSVAPPFSDLWRGHGREIRWNFEKNPKVCMPDESPGFFSTECGTSEARFYFEYMSRMTCIWESIPSNMAKWADKAASNSDLLSCGPYLVPLLLPNNLIARSLVLQRFSSMFSVGDVDLSRPIDVLFYGGKNPHREQVKRIIERKLVEEHGLRVVFAMDYNLFGIAREVAIENAKIILNLGNTPWPPANSETHRREHCRAPANYHRIRALLARGKMVVSERTGMTYDEEILGGVVVFSDTDTLPDALLALLSDPLSRRGAEERALQYILEDHTQPSVTLSNGSAWPSSISHLSVAVSLLASDLRKDSSGENYNHVGLNGSALFWLLDQCFVKPMPIIGEFMWYWTATFRTTNISSACHNIMDTNLLVGYVSRKFYFQVYLEVGCSSDQAGDAVYDTMTHRYCIRTYDDCSCSGKHINIANNLESFLVSSFARLPHSVEVSLVRVQDMTSDVLTAVVERIMKKLIYRGIIIISGLWPLLAAASESLRGLWKVITIIRSMRDYDCALGYFDGGVLVVMKRSNPVVLPLHCGIDNSVKEFSDFIDRYVPVLNIHELDEWLSDDLATTMYIDKNEKYCEMDVI